MSTNTPPPEAEEGEEKALTAEQVRIHHLDLPPIVRINKLFRDHTQEQFEEQPIGLYVYDIVKWIELAERHAAAESRKETLREYAGMIASRTCQWCRRGGRPQTNKSSDWFHMGGAECGGREAWSIYQLLMEQGQLASSPAPPESG